MFRSGLIGCLLCFLLGGCAGLFESAPIVNNNLNNLLWMQTATEYKANAIQAYNAASHHIDQAINDSAWTALVEQGDNFSALPVAIVLDIDSTVLDNSPYEAQLVLERDVYEPASWERWLTLKAAPAVPGAVDFIAQARTKGVQVLFVTNRECIQRPGTSNPCPQEQETIDNLANVGINNVTADTLFLKKEQPNWTSEKKSRRELIAKKYRVIMLFGDDLGDFLSDVRTIAPIERERLAAPYRDYWAKKWFVFSNPLYGSWLSVLGDPKSDHLTGY